MSQTFVVLLVYLTKNGNLAHLLCPYVFMVYECQGCFTYDRYVDMKYENPVKQYYTFYVTGVEKGSLL